MKPRLPGTPAKLALAAVLGSLIASLLFIGSWIGPQSSLTLPERMLIAAILFGAGLMLVLRSVTTLKNGVENQRWPDPQIEPLRKCLESHSYTALTIVLLVAYATFGLIVTRLRDEGWICFLLMMTLSQLRFAVRRPAAPKPGPLSDWLNFGPLRSNHWGKR